MQKTEFMRFRVEPWHAEKMKQIKVQTGIGASELLRRMIEKIEIRPVDTKVVLFQNANSDVNSRQGSHVAVAA